MAGRDADVVVVGAGLAGLTAARALTATGRSVIVLEARGRVGGRTLNHELGDGKVVEVGGQWVGPTQHRVSGLVRELGLELFPTHGIGERLVEWDGDTQRYTGTIPAISKATLLDVGQAQARLDRMARQVPLEAPWAAKRARQWDGQTMRSWMNRNVATRGGRTMLEIAVQGVWACDPEDLSLLHLLFYIHSAGSFDALLESEGEGAAQKDRVVGGTQLISVRMAETLDVRLSSPVRSIRHEGDGVVVEALRTGARGGVKPERVSAGHVVVALPPSLTPRIAYDPPLPGDRDQLVQRMPQGSVIKAMAIYDEPFWRADGLSGQAVSDRGPCRIVFDNSPPDGRPGVLLGFFEGHSARVFGERTADERRAALVEELGRLYGPRALRPEGYVERVWAHEEFSRGCYGCYMTPGAWTAHGPSLRAPVGRIHWAAAETGTVWMGYMDGAVQSGERAAAEIITAS